MSNGTSKDQYAENLRTVYQELCTSYRAIDDFRAKLLGFLPVISGAGVFLLLNDAFSDPDKLNFAKQFFEPIGIFGFAVTCGLFSYEIYGIRKCHAIIKAGQEIESEGKLEIGGQFRKRPRSVAGIINEPFAAGVIYPAVLAAWLFLALVFTYPDAARFTAICFFICGFAGVLIYNYVLGRDATSSASKQPERIHEEAEHIVA